MKAAVIDALGHAPVCREVAEPTAPDGWIVGSVRAAAIKNIERMLAAGTHYGGANMVLPAQTGLDAVVELPDGRRVYTGATPPAGAIAERMIVNPAQVIEIPDSVDDATAAALPNAAISAWFALEYAGQMQSGKTVLVLGGTGVTGGLAVQLATRLFDAAHVIAVGRDEARLEQLRSRGADNVIRIDNDAAGLADAVRALHAEHPIDLVLDYLWGAPAEQTLRALANDDLAATFHRTRFVQIGETAGPTLTLPASVLRSAGIELVGQGAGSVPREAFGRVLTEILPALFDMLSAGTLTLETRTMPLDQVESAWTQATASGERMVIIP